MSAPLPRLFTAALAGLVLCAGSCAPDTPSPTTAPTTAVPTTTTTTAPPVDEHGCPVVGEPLRSVSAIGGIDIGVAYRPAYATDDPCYEVVAGREFDSLTPEIATFPNALAPAPGVRNFADADAVCDVAADHDQSCHVHAVVWDPVDHPEWGIVPDWIRELSPTDRRAEMIDLVTDTATHFRGRVRTWTVVNEAFRADGTLWDSVWNTSGDDSYIFDAFRAARLADPTAELLYNDFGAEDLNAKSDAVYDLVTRLHAEQVEVTVDGEQVLKPLIDGVGLQGHFGIGPGEAPAMASMRANVDRLAAAGLSVRITELDVRVPVTDGVVSPADLATQAQIHRDVVELCVDAPNCGGVTLWGFTDRHSWITEHPDTFTGLGAAHPFDAEYRAKPALAAMRAALSGG